MKIESAFRCLSYPANMTASSVCLIIMAGCEHASWKCDPVERNLITIAG